MSSSIIFQMPLALDCFLLIDFKTFNNLKPKKIRLEKLIFNIPNYISSSFVSPMNLIGFLSFESILTFYD